MRRLLALISLLMLVLSLSISSYAQTSEIVHVVQLGENLYRISLRYGVSMAAIAERNNLYNYNFVYVGQYLYIPTGTTPPPVTPVPGETFNYYVQSGDTLAKIAARFRTTVAMLVSINNIYNPNIIYVGQLLKIPGTNTPPTTPIPPPTETVTYIVQSGDTLARIAARFGTTVQAIASLNGITNINRIYVGQRLIISGTGTPPPPNPTPPPLINTSFELGGQVLNSGYPYSNLMRQTGMVWAKRQIRWTRGTPASAFQAEIDAAKSRNFRVLLSVVGNVNELTNTNATQYYQEFAGFLGGLAAAGADGIEVWNEPNLAREWTAGRISGAAYTQMLSSAYQIIKANNRNTIVISAAPAPTGGFATCGSQGCNDDVFISQMASAGAANFMDCVGIHFNAGTVSPYARTGAPVGSATHYSWYYPTMVELYSRVFPTRPLCFTELGYLSADGYGQGLPANFAWAGGTSIQEHAQWLSEAVAIARSSGRVRMLIVWNVDSTTYLADDPQAGYAIIRPDGTCPACNTIGSVMNR